MIENQANSSDLTLSNKIEVQESKKTDLLLIPISDFFLFLPASVNNGFEVFHSLLETSRKP